MWPPHLHCWFCGVGLMWLHLVGAPSVHLPRFAPCMRCPGAVPGWVSLPGPAVAPICPFWCHLFATAVTCWMRECICDPCPPPLSPCLMHLPECGSGPWYTLCGLVALLSLPSIPHPSGGWWKSWILRVYIGHTWCGLAPRATRAGPRLARSPFQLLSVQSPSCASPSESLVLQRQH